MTYIKGSIPKELDDEFRKEIAKRFGLRKGALSRALEEAILQWIEKRHDIKLINKETPYIIFKDRLMQKYPDKFVILKDDKVLEVADSIIQASQQARRNYPEIKNFTVIHTVSTKHTRRQLGFRMRRRIP